MYRQYSIVDKRTNRNPIANSKFVFLQKNNLLESDSTDIDRNQSNYKIRIIEKNCKSSENLEISDKAKKPLYILQIYNR